MEKESENAEHFYRDFRRNFINGFWHIHSEIVWLSLISVVRCSHFSLCFRSPRLSLPAVGNSQDEARFRCTTTEKTPTTITLING